MKLVRLDSLFEVNYGHSLELCHLKEEDNGINFVSRTDKNNGVSSKVGIVKDLEPAPADSISVALGGSVLATFWQSYPFYCGRDIAYLTDKEDYTEQEKLYYIKCIKKNKFRYNYGRQANRTLASLMLPSREEIPQWVYETKLPDYSSYAEPKLKMPEEERLKLWKDINWGTFRLLDYFQSFGGQLLTKHWCEENPGNINFITSTTTNNGVNLKVNARAALKENVTILRNVISVSTNGQSCWAFYQTNPCIIGLDAVGLIPKIKMTTLQSLFVCKMIRKEAFRFNYGRKLNTDRLEKLTIGLPMNSKGEPDWDVIEVLAQTSAWTKNC